MVVEASGGCDDEIGTCGVVEWEVEGSATCEELDVGAETAWVGGDLEAGKDGVFFDVFFGVEVKASDFDFNTDAAVEIGVEVSGFSADEVVSVVLLEARGGDSDGDEGAGAGGGCGCLGVGFGGGQSQGDGNG